MREFDYSNLNNIKWNSEIINTLLEIQEHKGKQTLYLSQQPEELEKFKARNIPTELRELSQQT